MKHLIGIFLVLGLWMSATPAKAESYGYGYGYGYGSYTTGGYSDPSWAGLYGTGGASLYGFGTDMYSLGGYMGGGYGSGTIYGTTWGGSAGSLWGTSSGYDCANLYGGYGGYASSAYYNPLTVNINLNLGGYGSYGNCGTGCGSSYSPYNMGYNGCNLGCDTSYWQTMQNPCASSYGYYGSTCGGSQISTYPSYPSYYYPSYPMTYPSYSTFPSQNPYTGGTTINVNATIPPVAPPWGGCSSNFGQCPTGPVVPPVVTPTPTYTYTPGSTPVAPVRYTIPRTSSVHGG